MLEYNACISSAWGRTLSLSKGACLCVEEFTSPDVESETLGPIIHLQRVQSRTVHRTSPAKGSAASQQPHLGTEPSTTRDPRERTNTLLQLCCSNHSHDLPPSALHTFTLGFTSRAKGEPGQTAPSF